MATGNIEILNFMKLNGERRPLNIFKINVTKILAYIAVTLIL